MASAILFAPAFMASRKIRALAAELDDVRVYAVHITSIAPDKHTFPLRDENFGVGTSEVSLWGKNVVMASGPGIVKTYDPIANVEITQLDWDGTPRFMDRVRHGLNSTRVHALGAQDFEELTPESTTVLAYRFANADERFTLYMDEVAKRPVRCMVEEKELTGWTKREVASFDTTPSSKPPEGTAATPKPVDLRSSDWLQAATRSPVADFKMAEGQHYIVQADANLEGSTFFLLGGVRSGLEMLVTDDKGNKSYSAYEMPLLISRFGDVPPQTWARLYCIRNTDETVIHWPLALHVDMRAPFGNATSVGSFEFRFKQPTCSELPYYALPQHASDLPFYELKTQVQYRRGQYLGHLFRDASGKPVDAESPDASLASVRLSDRSHAIDEFLSALHYLRLEGPSNSAVSLADLWMSTYSILKELGQDQQAREAVQNAAAAYKINPATEHTLAEIQGALQDEGLTNP